jgi:hypothetical protein
VVNKEVKEELTLAVNEEITDRSNTTKNKFTSPRIKKKIEPSTPMETVDS